MMKVAIAGTNGLAFLIAHYLSLRNYHQFSEIRQPKPLLSARGWTVLVVDFRNEAGLRYHLAGIDLVISMVTGNDQLLMIDAALNAGVARFVPAEFAGISEKRPPALDRGQRFARLRLRGHVEEGMSFTLISCGILYERFAPGGLADFNTGNVSGANGEGDYLMNVRTMRAQIPHDSSQRPAMICMTAMDDVAKFIVAALDLPQWPTELRVCGQRMNVSDVVRVAERLRDFQFERADHTNGSLESQLHLESSSAIPHARTRVETLMATGEGAFDFTDYNFNRMVNITPTPFAEWLELAWANEFAQPL
ncbi:MAG: hypothetical protein LQ340_004487 [Diploschistes diacapsis]|nr:MAG: hypothetical protein LQ340_004487 [Diploschistes diacapsis]